MEEDFPESIEAALRARGFDIKRRGHIGLVNAIGIDPATNERLGAADPRDQGAAVGY
jgi:gamma-glutamyltranspeptidase